MNLILSVANVSTVFKKRARCSLLVGKGGRKKALEVGAAECRGSLITTASQPGRCMCMCVHIPVSV